MKKLEEIFRDPNIPENAKKIVRSMNHDGMQLLNDYYDENSNI
ncbi:hypothetical protein [Staphylococcus epidermidis]